MLYAANVGENDLPSMENRYVQMVREYAEKEGNRVIPISAKLEEEIAHKRSFKSRGYYFYDTDAKDDASVDDVPRLKALLTSRDTFQTYSPGFFVQKQCGGFHPDFALMWVVNGDRYELQICFGCGEARCFAPYGEVFCDIKGTTLPEFKSILAKYQRNRPDSNTYSK